MDILQFKREQLTDAARHRDRLRKEPHLRWLFFELTDRCNLSCRHCGSNCAAQGQSLTVEDVRRVLITLSPERPMICLTGGEPLLHPDFFEIAGCVRSLGFSWGLTTNATLIDDAVAKKLRQAGMATVSVSLDGLERSHDLLRRQKGAWSRAIDGLNALQRAGFEPQVTTVVHRENLDDLEPLYEMLGKLQIKSWRPINIEPIGRAYGGKDLLLSPEQFVNLLSFIREKRYAPDSDMEVTFGCSHYLGVKYERMVRDHYFLCGAGILVAGIRSSGDICACLDVPNLKELVQGNIRKDDFMQVWRDKFRVFRTDRAVSCKKCAPCPERDLCAGDSAHTWDFANHEPKLCYLDFSSSIKR